MYKDRLERYSGGRKMDFAWSAYCSVRPPTAARLEKELSNRAGRPCIIDINEVMFIDKGGQRLLSVLGTEGAKV